jgi:tetratricopeptide (TPR) repeat protein
MISSDPEVINGSLGCYEIGNYLISCGEYEKAQAFITIGLKYSPDNPYLLWAMGGAFYAQDDYVNAYLYLFLARKRLSTDLALEIALNLTKEKLVDQGKANVVLAISTKYK